MYSLYGRTISNHNEPPKRQQKTSMTCSLNSSSQERKTAHVQAVKLKAALTPAPDDATLTRVTRLKGKKLNMASSTNGRKL